MAEPISVEDVIARIDEWKGRDVRCEELGGGITNRNYVVTVDGDPGAAAVGRFVLRIPGEGTEAFIDRTRELNNHAAAAAAGVTPPLLHVIQPGDCTVVPFIPGETMHPESIAGHPDRLEKIVAAMRTYHEKAVFANEIRLFDMVRQYLRMAQDVNAPRPEETAWMLVLTAYCGGMDEHRYARMQLHKLVADLWWSIWAMIQASMSKLDFDFYEYGMNRMRRFQNNAADPDYEAWLEAV